ncbi:MAG: SET domain-containing protein [Endozoicomonas sp.]
MLYVADSHAKGRGVFTDEAIPKGALIENCPVLEIPLSELKSIDATMLYNYYFAWGKEQKGGAIALGLGSIYNHSYLPNAVYVAKQDRQIIEFRAIKAIQVGEEVTINYNGFPDDRSPLWDNNGINWVD